MLSKTGFLFTSPNRRISKKHQIRLDTPWLDPTKTLAEQASQTTQKYLADSNTKPFHYLPVSSWSPCMQDVTEGNELILMYRFYYHLEQQRYTCIIIYLVCLCDHTPRARLRPFPHLHLGEPGVSNHVVDCYIIARIYGGTVGNVCSESRGRVSLMRFQSPFKLPAGEGSLVWELRSGNEAMHVNRTCSLHYNPCLLAKVIVPPHLDVCRTSANMQMLFKQARYAYNLTWET